MGQDWEATIKRQTKLTSHATIIVADDDAEVRKALR